MNQLYTLAVCRGLSTGGNTSRHGSNVPARHNHGIVEGGRREKSPGLSPSVSSGFSPPLPFPPSFGRARATIQHGRRTGRRTKQAANTAPHYTDSLLSPPQATPVTQRTVKTRGLTRVEGGGNRAGWGAKGVHCLQFSSSTQCLRSSSFSSSRGLLGWLQAPAPKTQGPGKEDARCPLNRCQALPATRASRKVSVLAAFPYHLPSLQPPASQCSL